MIERLESLARVLDGSTLMPWTIGLETQWVISPFRITTGAKAPQTTPRELALLTPSRLALFGSRWEQLPG
jgi:hypothetical protein